MERILERDELRSRLAACVPISAGELQARFDGLGAAVAEKRARQPGKRREPFGSLPLQRVEEQVRRMEERGGLLGDHAGKARIRVAERRDTDPRQKIEVLLALGIVE